MTLMAGPIDTRVNPTKVNKLATSKPIELVRANLIARVPVALSAARGRQVYPGFVQLTAFMSMNINRHYKAHQRALRAPANGEHEKAQDHQGVLRRVFRRARSGGRVLSRDRQLGVPGIAAAEGRARLPGQPVEPEAIRKTALLTVEGERDDICALGQTAAAHDLCTGLRPHMKRHHMQAGVGHYGVFSGRKWEGRSTRSCAILFSPATEAGH